MNLAILLTFFRILLVPVMVVCFYWPHPWAPWWAMGVFAAACFTDWLDGVIARALNQTSRFGAFLDPLADKLIVSVALVLIVGHQGSAWLAIPAAVIVAREILISGLREWMAELGNRQAVQVGQIGKYKTAVQMISIMLLMILPADMRNPWVWLGTLLLYLSAALTLWSMTLYLKAAWRGRHDTPPVEPKKIEYIQANDLDTPR